MASGRRYHPAVGGSRVGGIGTAGPDCPSPATIPSFDPRLAGLPIPFWHHHHPTRVSCPPRPASISYFLPTGIAPTQRTSSSAVALPPQYHQHHHQPTHHPRYGAGSADGYRGVGIPDYGHGADRAYSNGRVGPDGSTGIMGQYKEYYRGRYYYNYFGGHGYVGGYYVASHNPQYEYHGRVLTKKSAGISSRKGLFLVDAHS